MHCFLWQPAGQKQHPKAGAISEQRLSHIALDQSERADCGQSVTEAIALRIGHWIASYTPKRVLPSLRWRPSLPEEEHSNMLILLIILILVLGGGGGYYGHSRWGYGGGAGIGLGTICVILLIVYLLGGFR